MGTLERELAHLMEMIRQAHAAADHAAHAQLSEQKQRLCSLMSVLG